MFPIFANTQDNETYNPYPDPATRQVKTGPEFPEHIHRTLPHPPHILATTPMMPYIRYGNPFGSC